MVELAVENIELVSSFTIQIAVTPSKIFVKADNFVNAAFVGGADKESLNFDCLVDSGSLITTTLGWKRDAISSDLQTILWSLEQDNYNWTEECDGS